jgi:hypothetical protein
VFQRTDNGSISPELFHYIRELLPDGATILELGSGEGTRELSKSYRMYSIEHNRRWLNKYKSTYIHAPLVGGWYDVEILDRNLPETYDLILVDGPPAHKKNISKSRYGFYRNIRLFNTKVPVIIDDVHRPYDREHLVRLGKLLGKEPKIFKCKDRKMFGVLK